MRTPWAKEVLQAVRVPRHRVSPVWRFQCSRVMWLARQARTLGAGKVLVQTILEGTDRPPDTTPLGRGLQSVRRLRWEAVHGSRVWCVPGQREHLHLVLGDWGEVCPRVRESRRYTTLAALQRRRSATFGGLEAEVCRPACTEGMTVASSETERSLLRALQAGATWTAARVRKHQISVIAACPYCSPPPPPRDGGPSPMGLPAVANTAGRLAPAVAGRGIAAAGNGLLLAALVGPKEVDQVGRLMYRPYGMYVAVLSARTGAEVVARRNARAGPPCLCDCAQTSSPCAPGLPLRTTVRRPASPGAAGFARRPAAGVAVGGVFRNGAPAVRKSIAVATRVGPRDVGGAAPRLRGPRRAGSPGPQQPPVEGGHVAARHHGPSAENGPGCAAPHLQAGDLLQGKDVWMAKSLLPPGGLRVCGQGGAPTVCAEDTMLLKCARKRRATARFGRCA